MHLFEPLLLRGITVRNRIAVSPMCQYSANDGTPNDWHLVHLGSRAVGGAGLVIAEASATTLSGRISPEDAGIYLDSHVEPWHRITRFIRAQGALACMQLAHAGRKASTAAPWRGGKPLTPHEGGWLPISAPSALAFADGYAIPEALDMNDIKAITGAFQSAASRSLEAGFDIIEIHAAHGYLLHQFLSPISNRRSDRYGGSFENRIRLCLEVIESVRRVWPDRLPLFIRISATDWLEGGWDIEQSIELARRIKPLGVDLIDCSSGGLLPNIKMPVKPGYQVPFAERIRVEAQIATGAVGLITEPNHARQILEDGKADIVLLGREFLRDPYWTLRAQQSLCPPVTPPPQYLRAWGLSH